MKLGNVIIGDPAEIDDGVTLGYLTGRPGISKTLTIGTKSTIRSGTVIYAGTTIGHFFATGHGTIIREENTIGDHVSVWSQSVIDYGCTIGHHVLIHNLVYIAQFTVIEDHVFIAPGVKVANDRYPINKEHLVGPHICTGAVVGINATLMPGVRIGENAVIGGGSVVTRDIPDHMVAVGSPAKVVGTKEECYAKEQK